nr:MAG TPA: LPP20 lipoprotein factor [Caudoviricetes sp.]
MPPRSTKRTRPSFGKPRPWLVPIWGGSNMRRWLKRWTLLPACAVSLPMLALMLSGCAGPPRYVSEEPAPLPAVLSAPQSQRAKAYSEKVSSFSQRVESYFKSQPEFTTQ